MCVIHMCHMAGKHCPAQSCRHWHRTCNMNKNVKSIVCGKTDIIYYINIIGEINQKP